MNTQAQLITFISIILFILTLSPISLVLIITLLFNISNTNLKESSQTQIPCAYKESMKIKLLNHLLNKPLPPIVINKVPNTISPATGGAENKNNTSAVTQKEVNLQTLSNNKTKKSNIALKAKSLGRFIKKIASKAKSLSTEKNKTQYKIRVAPIVAVEKNYKPVRQQANGITSKVISATNQATELTAVSNTNTAAANLAERIWRNDITVYSNLDRVVEWIGNGSESSNAILKTYIALFDFTSFTLEHAFRNLCTKLSLKGETQQIDRILSEFSCRYYECNPKCIFGNADTIHAIVYSLLLLNTDLHVAQGDHKKMNRSEFVANTFSAIQAQTKYPSPELESQSRPSFQSETWDITTPFLQRSLSRDSNVSAQSAPNSNSTIVNFTFGSPAWQMEIKALLKQMYSSIRQHQIDRSFYSSASIRSTASCGGISSAIKRMGTPLSREKSTTNTAARPSSMTLFNRTESITSYLSNTELPSLYASNAPYYKEGMVVRKHLLEKTGQKAKQRDWKEYFMVIEQSELSMYKLESAQVVGAGAIMQLMGSIDLKHTLANPLPFGYSQQRQHTFALHQANGGVYIFQAGSADQMNEWVDTCNYWAARESKEPLVGGVSSMEYGWSTSGAEEVPFVHEWKAPSPPAFASTLGERTQLAALYKHVDELTAQLDAHRDGKAMLGNNNINSVDHRTRVFTAKAAMNWENKSRYLLTEIIKYQKYCDAIEKSIRFQSDIMAL